MVQKGNVINFVLLFSSWILMFVGRGCSFNLSLLYCLVYPYISALGHFVRASLFGDDSSRTFLFVSMDLSDADSNKHIRLKATLLKSFISNLMLWWHDKLDGISVSLFEVFSFDLAGFLWAQLYEELSVSIGRIVLSWCFSKTNFLA